MVQRLGILAVIPAPIALGRRGQPEEHELRDARAALQAVTACVQHGEEALAASLVAARGPGPIRPPPTVRRRGVSDGARIAAVPPSAPGTARTVEASKTLMSRTMLPSDANPYGNVHGGEVMKLIDAAAGAAATRHARARVVTARIDELSFLAPVYVGHLVTARASVNHVGRTSMEEGVRVDAEDLLSGKVAHVASAYLVFVATDDRGRPVPLPPVTAETDEERRRMAAAETRRSLRLHRPRTP